MFQRIKAFFDRNGLLILAFFAIVFASSSLNYVIGVSRFFDRHNADSAPPSVAASAAPDLPPESVTIDGHTATAPAGHGIEVTIDSTRSGGGSTENHERRSTGTGAGLHTSTEGGAVGFTGGSAPNASLGVDDTGGASGGSSGSLKQTFAGGLNLCQLAAIGCAGFAVWFLTRKPPNKVAAIYSGIAAGGLWYAGEHPWVIVAAVLVGLCVLAWKASLLGTSQGLLGKVQQAFKLTGEAGKQVGEALNGITTPAEDLHLQDAKTKAGV